MSTRSLFRLGLAHVFALAVLALVLVTLQPALAQARPLATSRPYPGAGVCATTLQACISGSADGDRIVIAPGTYLTASLDITRAVSLVGGGADASAVKLHSSGGRMIQYSAVPITVSFVISNLTVENGNVIGSGSSGGGIRVANPSGVPLFVNLVISNNLAVGGGGIRIIPATPATLINVTVFSNTSTADAGGISASGSLTLVDSRIELNSAAGFGGGLAANGELRLVNTLVRANSASSGGGGVYALGPTTVAGGSFERNVVSATVGLGGGLLVSNTLDVSATQFLTNSAGTGGGAYVSSTLTLSHAQFISNSAKLRSGGGVFAIGATTVDGGQFENNIASDSGGGLFVHSDLSLTDVQVLSNTATTFDGGGANVLGTATLNGGRFQNNRAAFSGGGLNVDSNLWLTATQFINNRTRSFDGGGVDVLGKAQLTGGLFENNVAAETGGGVAAFGALTLTGMDFIGNSANGSGAGFQGGGGASAAGSLLISDTRFISNSAVSGGGGFHVPAFSTANALIVNSLFARNQSLQGAALRLDGSGSTLLLHTTIADTGLNAGPALAVFSGTLGISDTIIVRHSIAISLSGGSVFEDYNLFFGNALNATAGVASGGHHVFADPQFVNPAADDYHLGSGSPAINAGTDVGLRSDFDGDPRPIGGGFDIGFDEALWRLYLPLVQR